MFPNMRTVLACAASVIATATLTWAAEKQPIFNYGPIPPEFIISAEDGARSHDHISIKADLAERLSHICQENAKKHGGSATVVILDPFGQIIHEHRMDGQTYINQKAA